MTVAVPPLIVSPATAEGTMLTSPPVLTKRKYCPFMPPSSGRLIVKAVADAWTINWD